MIYVNKSNTISVGQLFILMVSMSGFIFVIECQVKFHIGQFIEFYAFYLIQSMFCSIIYFLKVTLFNLIITNNFIVNLIGTRC